MVSVTSIGCRFGMHRIPGVSVLGRSFIWGLVSALLAGAVQAEVAVRASESTSPEDASGLTQLCWTLSSDGQEGIPSGEAPVSPVADWFCPECLKNPAYDAQAPLKRIEQRLIPKLIDEGDYTCEGFCQRWLLRPPGTERTALMFVRVGVPTVCGATGWCPGRIYERRQGAWNLVGSYGANEANELCLIEQKPGRVKLQLHSVSEPADAVEVDWRY